MPVSATSRASLDDAAQARGTWEHGAQLLHERDANAYRELFAGLDRIVDPQRRHWAAIGLLELGWRASTDWPAPARAELLVALADAALAQLECDPREPRLLRCAAVLLHELCSPEGRALHAAACALDPALAPLGDGLDGIAPFCAHTGVQPRAARLHPALPALECRARELAPHAQPALGMRLSLCMIVRDEHEMLPRCLESAAGAVDEIVVVDTGSRDDTVAIARSFGARVLHHEWQGSFAAARNASFDAATGDWLLYLDADEVLVREDAPRLRALTGRTWREAFRLTERSFTGELADGTAVTHSALRVFRNRPEYRFQGRVHEQIASRLPGYLPERVEDSGVRIEHYGYLRAVRAARRKSQRNIELLRAQEQEGPPDAFLHFNLGSEHAAVDEPQAALAHLQRAWELVGERADLEFAPTLASRLVRALRACGHHEQAIARAHEGLDRFPGFTDLVYEQALAAHALGDASRAQRLLERCLQMGDAPVRYTATAGCGTYLALVRLAELRREADDPDGAARLLERCASEHPHFSGAVLPYATALLAAGVAPEQVVARIERQALSPTARFILATALYEAGATGAGRSMLGASEAASLGLEAVSLLATLLEAVLRARDFDAFERVHALLVGTPIGVRERRQLLAEMYLDQGFLASAAEEWMAACAEGQVPDVRALVGLARVAAARGMANEMREFAAAALAAEPHNEHAANLLAQADAALV